MIKYIDIPCDHCGKIKSESVAACPTCGYPSRILTSCSKCGFVSIRRLMRCPNCKQISGTAHPILVGAIGTLVVAGFVGPLIATEAPESTRAAVGAACFGACAIIYTWFVCIRLWRESRTDNRALAHDRQMFLREEARRKEQTR